MFSPKTYALIIIGVTTLYTVVGGLYSVVVTDLVQFVIKLICSIAIGIIAMRTRVAGDAWRPWCRRGGATFRSAGRSTWIGRISCRPPNSRSRADGYTMFGAFFMMMVFKGVLVSMAGPAPNYDMQRILAAKSPKEAAMMSGLVTVVLFTPRFFMIAGITVLALVLLRSPDANGERDSISNKYCRS